MREIVIDYDSVIDTALLYSLDYDGGVGTLVLAETKNAPAMASGADMVNVRSLDGLFDLVDKTGFVYSTRNMVFRQPEGGDKCSNVYGVTGALRDRYIRRCIGVEMGQYAPERDDYTDVCVYLSKILPKQELSDESEVWESIMVALTAVLPDVLLVTGIYLIGAASYITISITSEEARILRQYMDCDKGHKVPIQQDELATLARESILDCARANIYALPEREDYHNDKAKELIRKYTATGNSNE